MMTNTTDILIIGGGVFGITAAIELVKRKHKVRLINPDHIPHHLAASSDINKVVRMEYGSDVEYSRMAEMSIDKFHEWNELFQEEIYHQVGYLMLCKSKLESESQIYERLSFQNLANAGYDLQRLNANDLAKQFPVISNSTYVEGNFNPKGGYVRSGRLIERLADYARSLGVTINEKQTAQEFIVENGQLQAVKTKEGNTFTCGHAVVTAGANTPYLVPELKPYMKATGHPVFWLKPKEKALFSPPKLCVFTADISNTGWYGFPLTEKNGVVKIAKHTDGLAVHPVHDDRRVTDADVEDMRSFVKESFPKLADAPLIYTRRCLYTDTLDGHYWIDHHPEIEGLSVSSGGSGHGFKMAPILGEMTADMVEGKSHQFSERYRWRHLTQDTLQEEEARYMTDRQL